MVLMRLHSPRLTVAGLSGDSGKTLVSLGMTRALVERGLVVRTAKKGPDYIDAAWLREASGADCVNLDTFTIAILWPVLGSCEKADRVEYETIDLVLEILAKECQADRDLVACKLEINAEIGGG